MYIILHIIIILMCITIHYIDNAPISRWEKSLLCSEIPFFVLEKVLGAAFNPRYMSVDKPIETQSLGGGGKRDVAFGEDFFVDNNYLDEVVPEPAWAVENHVDIQRKKYGIHRRKRGVDYMKEWHCRSKIDWIDLGPDYFPRYLRTVVCLSEKCWFGLYRCVPKSFTIKLLRKKKGLCINDSANLKNVGLTGLPQELKQLWVWEERAVNFCCDCVRL